MPKVKNNVLIEDAQLAFRNFSGNPGDFNKAGDRNFCVFLETESGKRLEKEGWNVRWLKPRDPEEEKQAYIQIAVSFKNKPPKIVIISSHGKTILDESTVNILDWAETKKVDLLINPYNWEVRGESGVKAYLKSMYVTIIEDELEAKYYDVPDSAVDSIGGCGNCDACDGSCSHGD